MYNAPQISSFCDKTGGIAPANYDKPLNTPGILPAIMQYVTILFSTAGGTLVFRSNNGSAVYQFTMVAGREYPIILFNTANPIILSGTNFIYTRSGEAVYNRDGDAITTRESTNPLLDWQGNPALNTVSDLEYRGF